MKAKEVKHAFYYLHEFYFKWDDKKKETVRHRRPIVTVCTGVVNGVFSRGISICSPSETSFIKKEGRKQALRNMLRANGRKKSGEFIYNNVAKDQLSKCNSSEFLLRKADQSERVFISKSEYCVTPTKFEKKIFKV